MNKKHSTNGKQAPVNATSKDADLLRATQEDPGDVLTSNQGLRISDDENQLKAGSRGPTLLEDFLFREKITHFDHERIPERVVHARGAAAHGVFEVTDSLSDLTVAKFLQTPGTQTPVFLRFSTVAGSRGSADTARDVRGFAVKFYTDEGNFDMVGNNIPVFFIQDAIKFPDLIHAAKPEQNNEIPQAATAHNTFWDFVSLQPESTHMLMWIMSDRTIPRSFDRMEGFGIHSFRLVNAQGQSVFIKWHFKPVAGMASLVWDEAQKLAGKDPDFHRRNLHDAIEAGNFPEWKVGVQVIPESDQLKYGFDILDASKIVPEELVPIRFFGKLTLNRNTDNYFAETEQVVFNPAHLVPGIDFSNDPLLQGRLFSYLDTQTSRIGVNWADLPINRPVAPVHNNQRDGQMRFPIPRGTAAQNPVSPSVSKCPMHALGDPTAFASFAAPVEGYKIRERSGSFSDHFSQATLFWNSMSKPEKDHIVSAFHFELNKCDVMEIRERMVANLAKVDHELASRVAEEIGVNLPSDAKNHTNNGQASPALSMLSPTNPKSAKGRKVGILVGDGVDGTSLAAVKKALVAAHVTVELIGRRGGMVQTADGEEMPVDQTALTASSVMYDGVIVAGGAKSVKALMNLMTPADFLREAFMHCKPIGALGEGAELLKAAGIPPSDGVLVDAGKASNFANTFVDALAEHRFFSRIKEEVPA